MLRIWIDANDRPRQPVSPRRHGDAFALPKFGIEKNLHPVTDFELLCHQRLFSVARPKHQTDPGHNQDAAIDRPLWVTCHETTWQKVNPLEEENATSKDKHYSKDIQKRFNNISHDGLRDYTRRRCVRFAPSRILLPLSGGISRGLALQGAAQRLRTPK